ncbi:MAG: shikimate kinase [Limnochordales bacterium]
MPPAVLEEQTTSVSAPIGRRIHIMGDSCAGKSTLGKRLARALSVDFVDMDDLNWQPGWVALAETDPGEFERRLAAATSGDGWVVAGSYTRHAQRVFWPRLDTVVWLDLPRPLLVRRVIARSWRRYRTKELLWGTNYERFWPQLMVWNKEKSLVWWVVTQYKRRRRQLVHFMSDPQWSHIRFVRLTSPEEIEQWAARVEAHVR